MSEAVTASESESESIDEREVAAKRFNVVVLLIAFGTLGAFLFVVYKAFESIRSAADEAGSAFGMLAPPQRKSRRKTRRTPRSQPRRPRIAGKS